MTTEDRSKKRCAPAGMAAVGRDGIAPPAQDVAAKPSSGTPAVAVRPASEKSAAAPKPPSEDPAGRWTEPGERIDDLHRNGYRIIQKGNGFCFGMDAVLLSGFAAVKPGETALDLGTGTGIIPILLEAKTKGRHFTGLEIQEESAGMAKRSVLLNGLEEKIEIVIGDIKEAGRIFGGASFDVVTANPPYMNDSHGLKNPDRALAIARHEVLCTLEDVVREGAGVLRPGGRFYMVHRPRRLIEIITVFTRYKLEPKRMKFVHPFAEKEANMVLIEAVRGGRPLLKVEKPLIVYREPGVYTDEIYDIYGY